MVPRGAESGREMGWEGRGGEGRKKLVDSFQKTLEEGDVTRERILIKLSLLQTQLLSEFFACLPSPLSKFSRFAFEGLLRRPASFHELDKQHNPDLPLHFQCRDKSPKLHWIVPAKTTLVYIRTNYNLNLSEKKPENENLPAG